MFSNNLWIEDEQHNLEKLKQVAVNSTPSHTVQPQRARSDSGPQQSTATVDEETTTDWTPEIPFENVSATVYVCMYECLFNCSRNTRMFARTYTFDIQVSVHVCCVCYNNTLANNLLCDVIIYSS